MNLHTLIHEGISHASYEEKEQIQSIPIALCSFTSITHTSGIQLHQIPSGMEFLKYSSSEQEFHTPVTVTGRNYNHPLIQQIIPWILHEPENYTST